MQVRYIMRDTIRTTTRNSRLIEVALRVLTDEFIEKILQY
jgi:hypothetical protein